MVFNATFNNITVISWRSVSLVEKMEYTEETTDLSQVTDKLYHIMYQDQIKIINEEKMLPTTVYTWMIFILFSIV
jgi:hypothetical protein